MFSTLAKFASPNANFHSTKVHILPLLENTLTLILNLIFSIKTNVCQSQIYQNKYQKRFYPTNFLRKYIPYRRLLKCCLPKYSVCITNFHLAFGNAFKIFIMGGRMYSAHSLDDSTSHLLLCVYIRWLRLQALPEHMEPT